MVRLRLTRTGRKKISRWRLGAFNSRTRRDGTPIEYLGTYDPTVEEEEKKADFNLERVEYWLSQGAQPSDTVASILGKKGVKV